MRRFLYENGLALGFLALFLLSLIGQSIAGLYEYNRSSRSRQSGSSRRDRTNRSG
jgi:hypothetical protein